MAYGGGGPFWRRGGGDFIGMLAKGYWKGGGGVNVFSVGGNP